MRLLDRYLTASFWKSFLGSLVIFSIAATALDFVSRFGNFFESSRVAGTFAEDYSSLELIALYYVAYLPLLLKEILPFITVVAGLFTLSNMLRNNEVFPVLGAGVSSRRLLAPLFVCGLLVSLGHMLFQEYGVPALSQKQIALKRFFGGYSRNRMRKVAHLRDGRGTVTRAGSYTFADRNLHDVVIHRPWSDAGFERWVTPRLEPDGEGWIAVEPVQILPGGVGELPRELPAGTRVEFGVAAEDVEALAAKHGTAEVSFSQLQRLVAKFPYRRNLRVALHKQIARPLTSFVLLLVGIPILLAAGRSLFLGGAVAFGLSAVYFFLDIFCTSIGDRGDLPPALAAWFPIVLFFALGVACLSTVRT
jgi:lipopolysaccharide export system permease protein